MTTINEMRKECRRVLDTVPNSKIRAAGLTRSGLCKFIAGTTRMLTHPSIDKMSKLSPWFRRNNARLHRAVTEFRSSYMRDAKPRQDLTWAEWYQDFTNRAKIAARSPEHWRV